MPVARHTDSLFHSASIAGTDLVLKLPNRFFKYRENAF